MEQSSGIRRGKLNGEQMYISFANSLIVSHAVVDSSGDVSSCQLKIIWICIFDII